MKRRTTLRLIGAFSTSRSTLGEPAAARITLRSMPGAYRATVRPAGGVGDTPGVRYTTLPIAYRARSAALRPLAGGYRWRVDFEAYAQTAVDLVNSPLADLADLVAL